MLRTIFALAAVGLAAVLSGCSHTTSYGPVTQGLTGSWQWVVSTGGIAGITRTPASVGYTKKAVYRPDGMYEEYRNDTLVRAVRFTLVRESSPFHSGLADVVHYADTTMVLPQEVTLVGSDTLRLADLCIDCFFHTYSRIH